MLLYFIRYSRHYLANVVRELSMCMDGANLAAYKEMLRVVKFVLDTRDYCLKLNPICENEGWDLVFYSNSNWAGNPETRISVTDFIIYLLGTPICWRSKVEKAVTLSISKAEYVARFKEICFIYFLLKGMIVDVEIPIVVRYKNVGGIFMAENSRSGVRTHYIDTRYHLFVNMSKMD
jgi:hypothetical protein